MSAQLLHDPVELMDEDEPNGRECRPPLGVDEADEVVVWLRSGAVEALVTTALAGLLLLLHFWALCDREMLAVVAALVKGALAVLPVLEEATRLCLATREILWGLPSLVSASVLILAALANSG